MIGIHVMIGTHVMIGRYYWADVRPVVMIGS